MEEGAQKPAEQGSLQLRLALGPVLAAPFKAEIVQFKALGSGSLCIEAELMLPVAQPLQYGSRFVLWQNGRPA